MQTGSGPLRQVAWKPGDVVDGATAPLVAECRAQVQVALEDRRSDAEQGVPPAGVALQFAPDGRRLAIGTVGGRVEVVSVPGGDVVATRELAEGAVAQVAFSPDGGTLYVGEQSPDAFVYALDAGTLADRWRRRLADDLETSAPPADDTMYGRFSLPGAYAIRVLGDGSLIVAGAHGWNVDGVRRNRSRIWRLGPEGDVRATFPAAGAADAIFLFPSVDEGGDVLVGVSRSAEGPAPADLPVGGLIDLALADLKPRWTRQFEPLKPYFKEVFFWEAVARGPDFAFAGLGDGRAFVLDGAGGTRAELEPGVPIVTAGVPIGVGVGFATASAAGVWYLTTATNIPWGSADPAARPPEVHPAENTVHAIRPDGTPRWDRSVREAVGGVVLSPDGTTLLVGAGAREADYRTDLYGAVLLDAATGARIATCSTASPTYFRPVFSPDGRWVAVSGAPYKTADGGVAGAYGVTVFR